MLKNDLVVALSEMDYYKNQAGAVINDVFHVIAEALAHGEKVTIRGFGTFEVKSKDKWTIIGWLCSVLVII